jgi:hypothetical protein
MIERRLVRLATAIDAVWWLARVMFSRAERRKLDAATQAMEAASFKGVDGLNYQHRIRAEWDQQQGRS